MKSHLKLSKYRGATFLYQTWFCFTRSLTQYRRQISSFYIELFVGLAAGLLMGLSLISLSEKYSGVWISPYTLMSPSPNQWLVPLTGLLIGLTCGLAASPAGVKVFGEEKPVYWREAAAGHNRLAYYLGKTLASIPRFVISSLHFAAPYQFLGRPHVQFGIQYLIIFLQFAGVYGLSVVVSFVVRRENASLLSVIVSLIVAIFCGYGPSLDDAKEWGILFLYELSYNKWAAEIACLFI
jgi:hypothetical protein